MRRLARPRISGGGALLDRTRTRTSSALQVWLWLLIFVFQNEFRISRSIQPGYLDFDNLPDTNFTCEGKVIGGYYADLEASCQMFHVCTVGQHEEPMDIKFLCLNGTVFDQETRVCERVDEVDCTKSEKFYSLNLELYGSTIAPPKPDPVKPQDKSTASTPHKPHREQESDPSIDEERPHRNEGQSDVPDSTEDPVQDTKSNPPYKPPASQTTSPTSFRHDEHDEPVEENQEEDEFDSENPEYEEDYTRIPPTTTQAPTTTRRPYTASTPQPPAPPTPAHSSLSPASVTSAPASGDPALLSPQEFIYRHRGPSTLGSEAISFQRQSFRPADGVYITHAPPQHQQQHQQHHQQQQFDHFTYESSRTAPRPGAPRPTPFVQRPQPAPFRATTLDPREQMSRPGASSQSSERHETSIKHRPQPYLPPLPAQRPLPFDPYYYDRKRSDEAATEISSLSARSVAPPVVTERPTTKPKSPPRVIVTASASVSDSNGKRLNYTVGNVVSAVKPIVPINYDDYKESDLIFDPFFLDVPKLKNRRKSRESRTSRRVIIVSVDKTQRLKVALQTTTSRTPVTTQLTSTTAAAWNPNDYVDDNYEPHAYKPPPPVPPVALLLPHDTIKHKENREKQSVNEVQNDRAHSAEESKVKFEVPISTTTAAWSHNDYVDDNYEAHGYSPAGHSGNIDSRDRLINELKDKVHRLESKERMEESRPVPAPAAVHSTSSQFTAAAAPGAGGAGAAAAAAPRTV